MSAEYLPQRKMIRTEKQVLGLVYGLLSAGVFSLALWGFDAFLLWQATSEAPWAKLAVGAPFILLIGGVAGWLAARIDHGLVSSVLWFFSGIGFTWIASHAPFEGVSTLTGLLHPDFQGLEIYPFGVSAKSRMDFLYPFMAVLSGVGGAFELPMVDGCLKASTALGRLLAMIGILPIFLPLGLLNDNLVNQPLREPVTAVADKIQRRQAAERAAADVDQLRRLGLRSLDPFEELILQPYRLVLGYFDPQSITETTIYIDFDGTWGTCYVIGGQVGFCQLSADRYLRRFACLLSGGLQEDCKISATDEALSQINTLVGELGASPELYIQEQRGNVVFVLASAGEDGFYRCLMRSTSRITIEACLPYAIPEGTRLAPGFRATQPVTPTAPASGSPTSKPLSGLEAVMLFQADRPFADQLTHYDLSVEIDFEAHRFKGSAQVDYVNAEVVPLEQLYFRLLPNGQGSYGTGNLEVVSVSGGGKTLQTQLSGNNSVMQVILPSALLPGQRMTLELAFHGEVPLDFGGEDTAGYGIYNLSEGVMSLSGWFPILAVYDQDGWNLDPTSIYGDSVYSDVAVFSAEVVVPEGVQVVSTGVETSSQDMGSKTSLRIEGGLVRDFYLAASRDFEALSRKLGETEVRAHYLPGHRQAARQALDVAAESLRAYNEKFGQHPYAELDLVEAPMRYALGVEFPGIFLVRSSMFYTPEKPEFTVTVSHEVSHQWWYGVVGNDVFEEPWLDEALATYCSSFYYEFGPAGVAPQPMFDFWQASYSKLVTDHKDDLVTQTLAYFESLGEPRIYGDVVYEKGALFFKALRDDIGDQAFFEALQAYYRKFRFGIATGDDLLALFEEAAGRSLDDFYLQWLYSKRP